MTATRAFVLKTAVCGLLALLASAPPLHASLFDTNLIVNGDAEAGPASSDGSQVVSSIPGWSTNGELNVVSYGTSGGFPLSTDPGPPNRGTNFFCGGQNDTYSTGTQLVNVSGVAAAIDSGDVLADLSGYLGGFLQDDNAVFSLNFSNSVSANLGSVSIGPVLAADRNDLTGLLFRQTNAIVPPGTRTILVTLQMTRFEGSFNDGYADNLSLILVPTLAIHGNGGLGTVNWPTNPALNHLQATTNLAQAGSWTAWQGPVAFNGTNFSTSLGFTNTQRYFRLTSP